MLFTFIGINKTEIENSFSIYSLCKMLYRTVISLVTPDPVKVCLYGESILYQRNHIIVEFSLFDSFIEGWRGGHQT